MSVRLRSFRTVGLKQVMLSFVVPSLAARIEAERREQGIRFEMWTCNSDVTGSVSAKVRDSGLEWAHTWSCA
jgi:hypothetical protein